MTVSTRTYGVEIRECRTPSHSATCRVCKQAFAQMMFIYFRRHANDSQWVCTGWECFECDRKHQEQTNDAV